MEWFFSQFAKPTGWTGRLLGRYMAKENKQINKWTIEFLDIQEGDHVVEIGFGSGQTMNDMLKKYGNIRITGIDPSEAMVYQALRRLNKRLINNEIMIFEQHADEFPYLNKKIDKVIATNNITFWKNPVNTLTEIQKQMTKDGKIAISLRPHEKGSTDETTELLGGQLNAMLVKAGFRDISIFMKETKPNDTVCVVGRKGRDKE